MVDAGAFNQENCFHSLNYAVLSSLGSKPNKLINHGSKIILEASAKNISNN